MRAPFDLNAVTDTIKALSREQLAAVRVRVGLPAAVPEHETAAFTADLFAIPPPLPDTAVTLPSRRNVRRQAQYNARRNAGICVACGRLPAAALHVVRCARCLEIQIRSASSR